MANNVAIPTGVTIAGLGPRALVAFLDVLPLSLLSLLALLLSGRVDATVMLVVAIATTLLSLGWMVFLWWGYSTRGQSPAARWLRIRVLRLADGHPLGWGAYFLRELVWFATLVLPVVWVVLVVMMVVHPRRRGWHDLAAKSVVVSAHLPVAPAVDARPVQWATVASSNMVGLPPHLSQRSFAAEPSAPAYVNDPGAGPIAALPDFASAARFAPSSGFAPQAPPQAGVPGGARGGPLQQYTPSRPSSRTHSCSTRTVLCLAPTPSRASRRTRTPLSRPMGLRPRPRPRRRRRHTRPPRTALRRSRRHALCTRCLLSRPYSCSSRPMTTT